MPVTTQGVGNAQGYALELAGVNEGFVHSFEGGSAVGDVVVEKIGPDHIAHKHLAGVKYDDITVTVGTGMGKGLYEFVKAAFDLGNDRYDMAIKRTDINQNVTWEMDVFHALVTGVGIPELNAAAKNVGMLTITFSSEYTRVKPGSGRLSQLPAKKPIQWITSNFRLTIPGLDCTRVSKIGALSLTLQVATNAVGEQRDTQDTGGVNVPNLVVTLAEQAAQTFVDWQTTFLIEGKNSPAQEKEGTLEILGPDLKEVLFTLKFHGLGIFRLAADKYEAGTEQIRQVTAEMYCESMQFAYGPGAVGS
jgi:T4-like virus tail tube protein gp19